MQKYTRERSGLRTPKQSYEHLTRAWSKAHFVLLDRLNHDVTLTGPRLLWTKRLAYLTRSEADKFQMQIRDKDKTPEEVKINIRSIYSSRSKK
jgi:hypothetical protein